MSFVKLFAIFISIISQVISVANAYELETHGVLTYKIYEKSILNGLPLVKDLGIVSIINSNSKNPFDYYYYDVSGGVVEQRQRHNFEGKIIQEISREKGFDVAPLSLAGWLLRGAIREDDVWLFGENPQDDPDGQIFRVLRHFYDPVNDRGLKVLWWEYAPAPDWATGSVDTFNMPNIADTGRRNHFTVLDAREAQWRALTGQDKYGNTTIDPGGTEADEAVRKAYWATTFRALGDVMHLIQDMAQPQHTRNDLHNTDYGHGETVYEKYTNARVMGAEFKCSTGMGNMRQRL